MCPPILLPSLDPSCDILVRSLQFIQIYRLPYTYHMYKSYGPYRLYMIIWYYMSSRFMDWYHLISIFFSDHRYIIDTWTSILWHLYGISPSDKAHTWPLGAPRPQGLKSGRLRQGQRIHQAQQEAISGRKGLRLDGLWNSWGESWKHMMGSYKFS